jgi:transcriptional regulator GlxA family with amidase domain
VLEPKTHLQQASLLLVIRIVEAQIEQEITVAQDQGINQRSLEDLFRAQASSIARSGAFSRAEVWKQS